MSWPDVRWTLPCAVAPRGLPGPLCRRPKALTTLTALTAALAAQGCVSGGTDARGADTESDSQGTGDDQGHGDEIGIGPVTISPSPHTHLALELRFRVDRASEVSVELRDDEGRSRSFAAAPVDGDPLEMRARVFGLRAEVEHELRIVAEGEQGDTGERVETYTPGPLPGDFPPITATGQALDDPEGWTFFNVYRWLGQGLDPNWGLIVAVDDRGRVVWYRRAPSVGDVSVTEDGRVFGLAAFQVLVEFDLFGDDTAPLAAADASPPLDSMHHELLPQPDGSFWTMSTELRFIDGHDDGMGGTTTYPVVADELVQITREGEVLERWSLFDVLADHLLVTTPSFHGPFWDLLYEAQVPDGGTKDWTHGNAVLPVPDWGVVITSLRHLDWIVAVDENSGELAWRLGPGGDFELEAGGEWFYHPHAPEVLDDGRMLVYDNGNFRPGTGPGLDAPYSRVVAYTLDFDTMRATESWSWTATPARYAPFLGDADMLPTGTVLVTDGGMVEDPVGDLFDPDNTKYGVLDEVDMATGDSLFSIQVGAPGAATSFSVYRGQRITPESGWLSP